MRVSCSSWTFVKGDFKGFRTFKCFTSKGFRLPEPGFGFLPSGSVG